MSGPSDASQSIRGDQNVPKVRKPRRNWLEKLPPVVIPAVPANAAEYRLSSPQTAYSPLQIRSPSSLSNSLPPSPSITVSPILHTTLLNPAEIPERSPDMSLLSDLENMNLLHLDSDSSSVLPQTKRYQSKWQRVDEVLCCVKNNFRSFGHFMDAFSENFAVGSFDPRSDRHRDAASSWMSGRTRFRPVHLIEAIYRNRHSVPRYDSVHVDELERVFDGDCNPQELHFSRPALSCWAAQLVGKRCAAELKKLGQYDPSHPNFRTHLQASVNSRMREKRETVTQENVFEFSMQGTADILKARAPLSWYITECMAAPRKNGVVVVRTRRPHPFVCRHIFLIVFSDWLQIQATALSSFAMARNRSANGYLALHNSIYFFAVRAHTDMKRILCRLGLSCHDTTAREALISMGAKRKKILQEATATALIQRKPACRKVLDNIQQYQPIHEHGIGKVSQLMTGTAATAILLNNCAPGAFDLDAYQDRIILNQRAKLTVHSLFTDIKFDHLHRVQALHVVRIFCEHVPILKLYISLISEQFRSEPVAVYRMPLGRKTRIVPLSANGHAEMETHGMKEAQKDFDRQVGYTPENVSEARILIWDAGDGGSVLSGGRVMRHLLPQGVSLNVYESFENRIWTPGLFHVQLNMVNALAETHFGPKATNDPSTLSRAASLASLYSPPKPSSSVYYPTTRTMQTIFRAQILDIWDMHLAEHHGLQSHFEQLASQKKLPTLEQLISHANSIVRRYASDRAYQTALCSARFSRCPEVYKFAAGLGFAPAHASPDLESTTHVEDATFTGDRVLANTILFRRDFLLWMELSDAISEGDIGRVYEVLKVSLAR